MSIAFARRKRETPPRTWRRPPRRSKPKFGSGNTSTDVEKTNTAKSSHAIAEKHLHGRGEDSVATEPTHSFSETPPRTWRRLINESKHVFSFEKHLHGRGEDRVALGELGCGEETPPRTWRRLRRSGETSHTRRKHLHGRGEDGSGRGNSSHFLETPPRTWRRPSSERRASARRRNTSTDVEKTQYAYDQFLLKWKHLHGRGEDSADHQSCNGGLETPPRTWRRRHDVSDSAILYGNTSTDVEKTEGQRSRRTLPEKHLHGRGEDAKKHPKALSFVETPPRTWRRLKAVIEFIRRIGNTSTDVEKTARFGIKSL